MARLGSYYGLCPLIDSKSLLGIAEDPERGVIIVTLGKNIACRYKLSDQKQVSSWKTKEKFCSSVIYDTKLSAYLAVFNHYYIKLWNADEQNLDKLKKYKFKHQIFSLISDGGDTFILFQNGAICNLTDALEKRKDFDPEPVISDLEHIEDILYKRVHDHFYFGMLVRSSHEELNLYWTKSISDGCIFSKIKLHREGLTLKGYVFHIEEMVVNLVTLWSHGRIISYPLDVDEITPELFTSVESISTKHSVSMLSLDENYIFMYGANRNEEGAILIIYNSRFKVTQSTLPFKLFTKGAKLWRIENNLFLPVGQNVAVIPFVLETEQLAALVGSHKTMLAENDDISIVHEIEEASWNTRSFRDMKVLKIFTSKITKFLQQGFTESIIIGEILPEIFEKHDIDTLLLCINHISDIPEKYIAQILKYIVTFESQFFSSEDPSYSQPTTTTKLMEVIMCKQFTEIMLIPHLRSELTVNDTLLLIKYICFLLSDDSYTLPSISVVKTEAKLIQWISVLIDSNYQKFLLSKDESVKEVLTELLTLTKKHLHYFSDLKLVSNFLAHHKYNNYKIKNVTSKYSIEQILLY